MKPSPLRKSRVERAALADLFGGPGFPPGFRYLPDALTRAEELALVRQFESLPFRPFEFRGYLGNRRVAAYGHRYDYDARTLRAADRMPAFLQPLKEIAGHVAGLPADRFEQVLVTEYAPGAGIGWHRDRPMFEDVVGLSFLTPCLLRLRRREEASWERRAVRLEPRSAYLLRGNVRDKWQHSIAPMDVLRYSVTLRTFRE
jgi:alkylated DNA repair dioxygenase AlkB